ncbi:HPP family protein [Terasakiella pusilla]|uniref:HPP family protein n=1 Tax=Terasakiella pusilla TaxID=64973 RepID=UPI000690F94D|nr:HPP family protein [Terasakiella pusilla]
METPEDQPISADATTLPLTEKRRFERLKSVYWSMISSSLAILILSQLNNIPYLAADAPLIIGAFGASAVLLFACPQSPYAHPYNVIVGHFLCAIIGVSAFQLVGDVNSLSMILAVSVAIGTMQLTHSLHPPGGATALIAVIGSEQIHQLGYGYVLSPVGIGIAILIGVAYVTNNLPKKGKWPEKWLPFEK